MIERHNAVRSARVSIGRIRRLSVITSVITEPELAIIHFKNTRKSGFACITLLPKQEMSLIVGIAV